MENFRKNIELEECKYFSLLQDKFDILMCSPLANRLKFFSTNVQILCQTVKKHPVNFAYVTFSYKYK